MELNKKYRFALKELKKPNLICIEVRNSQKLADLELLVRNAVEKYDGTRETLEVPKVGDAVLVMEKKWNKWLRGRVVSHSKNGEIFEIHAVDYEQRIFADENCWLPQTGKLIENLKTTDVVQVELHALEVYWSRRIDQVSGSSYSI